jgi:hypothetical protein
MKIISHRGNLTGPNPERENTVEAIEEALKLGFPVEFDIWYNEGKYWLGHDKPQYETNVEKFFDWSEMNDIYIHCKNVLALQMLMKDSVYHDPKIHSFFHDIDDCIMLDNFNIWVHPKAVESIDQTVAEDCIAVLPKRKTVEVNFIDNIDLHKWNGICTDYPVDVRNSL